MAYKTLIFGTDDIYEKLKPFYAKHVKIGNLKIVDHAVLESDRVRLVKNSAGGGCRINLT